MATETIAANLQRLRHYRHLTQAALAKAAGLSIAAYRQIETGQAEPRVGTLQSIARVLDVGIQDLVAPAKQLQAVRFRSLKRLRSRNQILVMAGNWLDDFNCLEDLLDDHVARDLPRIVGDEADAPLKAAARVRRCFKIGPVEPVRNIGGLLEAHGVKVGQVSIASHDFFGLSIAAADGGPAIIVNSWDRISVERWIFTAAHELGHLVMHLADYDVTVTQEMDSHERQANAFASAFLMPQESFEPEWQATYGLQFVDRVLKVKRIFRVSYRSVLHRLAELRMVQGNVWAHFQGAYRQRHGKTLLREDEPAALAKDAFRASFPEGSAADEPESLSPVDFPGGRLGGLVRTAMEKGLISLGRGAEVLGLSLEQMRETSANWVE